MIGTYSAHRRRKKIGGAILGGGKKSWEGPDGDSFELRGSYGLRVVAGLEAPGAPLRVGHCYKRFLGHILGPFRAI